jgi:hypothetical protein
VKAFTAAINLRRLMPLVAISRTPKPMCNADYGIPSTRILRATPLGETVFRLLTHASGLPHGPECVATVKMSGLGPYLTFRETQSVLQLLEESA